jgi:hypothetical protein
MPCNQFCTVKCHLRLPRQQKMKISSPSGTEGVIDGIFTLQGGNCNFFYKGVRQNSSTLYGVKVY